MGWRRILTYKSFGKSSDDLCTSLAEMSKKLCNTKENSDSLEAFLACRLIPLDKNLELRPIGIGEVLRRLIGKTITALTKEIKASSVGSLHSRDAKREKRANSLTRTKIGMNDPYDMKFRNLPGDTLLDAHLINYS